MIIIDISNDQKEFELSFRYSHELVALVKTIPGRRWNPEAKRWTVPVWPETIAELKKLAHHPTPAAQKILAAGDAPRINIDDLPDCDIVSASNPPLWKHQRKMIALAKNQTATLWHVGMGAGKTRAAIDLIQTEGYKKVLVVCPLAVVAAWEKQIDMYSVVNMKCVPLDRGGVTKKMDIAKEQVALCNVVGAICVVVINYESLWREPFRLWSLGQLWPLVIYDECVPAGTMISTPDGDVDIVNLKNGDVVYGFDHNTGSIERTRVTCTFKNKYSGAFVNISGVKLTPNHPVWTEENGYIPSFLLTAPKTLCYINSKPNEEKEKARNGILERVLVLWEEIYSQIQTGKILSKKLFCKILLQDKAKKNKEKNLSEHLSVLQKRLSWRQKIKNLLQQILQSETSICKKTRAKREFEKENTGMLGKTRIQRKCSETSSFRKQSIQEPSYEAQGTACPKRARIQNAQWWERPTNTNPTKIVSPTSRMEYGGCGVYEELAYERASKPLQDRRCRSDIKNSNRGRWGKSRITENKIRGQSKRRFLVKQRMESFSVQKQRSNGEPGDSGGANFIFNIETETGNYFANGLLVHNCQNLKAPGGKAARFAHRLTETCDKVLGLSGTPLPHSPLDAYAVFRALDDRIFGTSYTRFRARYAVMGGYQNKQVVAYVNQDEMTRKIDSIRIHVGREVLDLPEAHHIEQTFKIDEKAMAVYRELEKEFYVSVENGEVSVSNALTKLLRLQQITSGYLPLDTQFYDPEILDESLAVELIKHKMNPNPEKVVEHLHDNKADQLRTILDGLEMNEPVVVFCRFKTDLAAVHRICADLGRGSLEISGARKELKEWQDGGAPVIATQIRSGREGIDLTRAHYCIYYSLGFSLGEYEQSLARCHRPGARSTVYFYHLIALGTVDQKIYKAIREKKDIIDSILENKNA